MNQTARDQVVEAAKAVVSAVEATGEPTAWFGALGKLITAVRHLEQSESHGMLQSDTET